VYSQITVGVQPPSVAPPSPSYIASQLPNQAFPLDNVQFDPLPAFNADDPVYPVTFAYFKVTGKQPNSAIALNPNISKITADGGNGYQLILSTTEPTSAAFTAILNRTVTGNMEEYGFAAVTSSGSIDWITNQTLTDELTASTEFWCVVSPEFNDPPSVYNISINTD
jgi:hypothetical protein